MLKSKKYSEAELTQLKENLLANFLADEERKALYKSHTKMLKAISNYADEIKGVKISNRIPTSITVLKREITKVLDHD